MKKAKRRSEFYTLSSGLASRLPFLAVVVLTLFVMTGCNPASTGVGTTEPSIGLSPKGLSFSAVVGGANPTAQTVAVTNTAGGTLSGLSASVSYTSGSGWLGTASLNTTTAPATMTVQPSTGSLSAGTYVATVSVASEVAGNSPQTVAVTFTVLATGVVPGSFAGTEASVAEGASFSISLVLNNYQSSAVTASFGVDFYLATTSTFNPTSDTLLGTTTVSSGIGAGSNITINPSFTMPTVSSPNQDFYLYAVVGSNVSTVADAAVVLVYDSSNGSRIYNVILQTYDPTSPTTNLTGGTDPAEVDTVVAYYSAAGDYLGLADPTGPGYGYQAIGSISSPLHLVPGTYYVMVVSYTPGPYAMAVITGNIGLQTFPTALTQDPYTTDGTPTPYPWDANLSSLPTHPVQMNLGSMVNRYSANGAWDWFTFTLP